MNAAENDHRLAGGGREPAQIERIPEPVGDVLDLRRLVVVREYDRAPLGLERQNPLDELSFRHEAP